MSATAAAAAARVLAPRLGDQSLEEEGRRDSVHASSALQRTEQTALGQVSLKGPVQLEKSKLVERCLKCCYESWTRGMGLERLRWDSLKKQNREAQTRPDASQQKQKAVMTQPAARGRQEYPFFLRSQDQ
jgi:hypothetical protein